MLLALPRFGASDWWRHRLVIFRALLPPHPSPDGFLAPSGNSLQGCRREELTPASWAPLRTAPLGSLEAYKGNCFQRNVFGGSKSFLCQT